MHTAGARALRADDNEMSREAVLLQWEQKIEAAERLEEAGRDQPEDIAPPSPSGRFTRTGQERGRFARTAQESDSPTVSKPALALVEPDVSARQPRFERSIDTPERTVDTREPAQDRRTITITGQPPPARRRRSVVEAQIAQPDRIALWAFLLGLFLVAVAAGTAHA